MPTWVLAANRDRTELLLTSQENWNSNEFLRLDTEGNAFTERLEFSAASYAEAREKYEAHFGLSLKTTKKKKG